jgi:polyisoprenoid-binding protein YceI
MTSRIPALLLAAAAAGTASAATTTWKIDPNHSAAHFTVRHMMVSNVRGEFSGLQGTVTFDDQNPSHSAVEATIDAASVNTRVAARDNDLKSPNFLDVAKYPTISFKSTKVTAAGPDKFILTGDLTMHGVTRPVTLEVDATPAVKDPMGNERRGAEATTSLNRKDFGLSWSHLLEGGGAVVGDEIKITLDIEAVRPAEKKAPAASN